MLLHRPTAALPILGAALLGLLAGCASGPNQGPRGSGTAATPVSTDAASAALQQATTQVIATERAFAATMANRDFKAFLTFLSPDAIFFSGSTVERGAPPIAEQWAPYFRGGRAPFGSAIA